MAISEGKVWHGSGILVCMLNLVLALILFLPLSVASTGKGRCDVELQTEHPGFEQYLRWSEQANTSDWRESIEPFDLKAAVVARARVTVRPAADIPSSIPAQLQTVSGQIIIPQHPYNTSDQVAFFNEPRTATLRARFLASRSLVVWQAGQLPFSIKLGTNYPHRGTLENNKIDVESDIKIGMARSEYVGEIDARLGPAKYVQVLKEVMAVTDKAGKKGYLVRDLTPLLDGHYYLPAFSIPYAGHEIAGRHKTNFEEFWGEHYAAALGRAKAELLLRYRFHYDQANAQNIILQMDKDLKPTGKFIFFDLGDTSLVEWMLATDQRRRFVVQEFQNGKKLARQLNPDWTNSWFQMDKGGVNQHSLSRWERLHNAAFLEELGRQLGGLPPLAQPQGKGMAGLPPPAPSFRQVLSALEGYLNSPEGQRRLAKWPL